MKLPRDTALRWHFFFDQLIPPFLRDCRWFMAIPMRVVFHEHAAFYLDFKQASYRMCEEEFRDAYRRISNVAFSRETDLNEACIERILREARGPSVLEVGCGRGFLARLLAERFNVTAVDIVISPELKAAHPAVRFEEANIESLPFPDHHFDMVVCTHTLEHVRNLHRAIAELRRVARRLILVVPRQRPYKYTFDLHLNFFPYSYSLLSAMGRTNGEAICEDTDGDLFYLEDVA